MERIDQIMDNPLFKMSMAKIREFEKDREFCCHGIEHSLDVARIAYIKNLEDGLGYSKEMIYAAALLHDIGRWKQYSEGVSHHEASEVLANEIIKEIDFADDEKNQILKAVRCHRVFDRDNDKFCQIIYVADKQSRLCFSCDVYDKCYWSEDKKNTTIMI